MKSVVSYPERGNYGKNSYRGNCSGLLIKDLMQQYKVKELSDYMVGSGTTEDVCREMKVPGTFLDLNRGFDLMEMEIPDRPENIFWHPPYGGMIVYSDRMYSAKEIQNRYGFDPRINDLSRCKDWEDFVYKMNFCMLKQFSSLAKGGHMFVLMGDWKQKGRLYSMLADIVKPGTLEQIIIKIQHNCCSDDNTYLNNSFIPIVHEYVMVVRKDAALIIPVAITKKTSMDVRDKKSVTWRDVVAAILEDARRPMSLQDIYQEVEGHKKCEKNHHWKEKIRQVLHSWDGFRKINNTWVLA